MDHPIFRMPHAVEPTLEDRPTPSNYAAFPGGRDLGATMPMWRVQTEGYSDGTDQLVGIVSDDAGFLDSPDTEWISGGVNTKGSRAVAIGRHGNFFHWGFAASPTYMTDEGKLVLVNAIHYIARFDGQKPIARKQRGVLVRERFETMIDMVSDEGYARVVAMVEERNAQMAAKQAETRARIDAGEEVSDLDRQLVDAPPANPPRRFFNVRRVVGDDVWKDLEEDPAVVTAFLRARLPYVYPAGAQYQLDVDADLMRMGVPNDSLEALERAIAMLGTKEDVKTGRAILSRYVDEWFETAEEWTAWLDANRSRLFFSESAGYKWIVDASGSSGQLEDRPEEPITIKTSFEPLGPGQGLLNIDLEIEDGWHAYYEPPADTPYVGVTVELELPDGVKADESMGVSGFDQDPNDPRLALLKGQVSVMRLLNFEKGAGGEVTCVVTYQLCDANRCLPPATKTLKRVVKAPRR